MIQLPLYLLYTLSLHDALPICSRQPRCQRGGAGHDEVRPLRAPARGQPGGWILRTIQLRQAVDRADEDRKSTRMNSSHGYISYADYHFKKKNSCFNHKYI